MFVREAHITIASTGVRLDFLNGWMFRQLLLDAVTGQCGLIMLLNMFRDRCVRVS